MSRQISFFELVEIARKNLIVLFLSGVVFALSVNILCSFMSSWYGVSVLIRAPQSDSGPGGGGAAASALGEITGASGTSADGSAIQMKNEIIAYATYQFLSNPKYTEAEEKNFYLKDVVDVKETNYVQLVVYGRSLKLASEHAQMIVSELDKFFKERIENALKAQKETYEVGLRGQKEMEALIAKIDDSLRRVGYNPVLEQKKADLSVLLLKQQEENALLKKSLTTGAIRLPQVLSIRPESKGPLRPKTFIFTVAGFFIGIFMCYSYFAYSAFRELETSSLEQGVVTNFPKRDHQDAA